MIATLDPNIFIVSKDKDVVEYIRIDTGETWKVSGTCNQCGLCVVGAANKEDYIWYKKAGEPYAVTDVRVAKGRLDEPITSEFNIAGCCLIIERN
jgi:hypothetical protein